MISVIISRVVIILFGTLYPAYSSYKAVKTKNVKEYVKWMMYWIVFALFTCIETFADIFISWLPFYYEIKIVFVIWLLSPATKGASILYRKFIHPQLSRREEEIDNYISKASDQGYSTLLTLGSKGFNIAANIVLSTAMKSQMTIVEQLKKSYSLNDLSQENQELDGTNTDVIDSLNYPKLIMSSITGNTNLNYTDGESNDILVEASNDEDEDYNIENRILTKQYENEINEKVKSEIDGSNIKTGSSSAAGIRIRKTTKDKLSKDLEPLPEHEESNISSRTVHTNRPAPNKSSTMKGYTHQDASHFGTLPRKTKYTRPPLIKD